MKKYIIPLVLLLLLTSCSNKNNNSVISNELPKDKATSTPQRIANNKQNISSTKEIDITSRQQIMTDVVGNDLSILCIDPNYIFYKTTSKLHDYDAGDKCFYAYDKKTKHSKLIAEIKDITITFDDMAIVNKTLYYPYTALDEKSKTGSSDYILSISQDNLDYDTKKFGETFCPRVQLYSAGEQLFRFHQKDIESNCTDFYLDKIDKNNNSVNTITAKYKDGTGEIMVCVYSDNNYIYVYSIDLSQKKEKYLIKTFDLNGTIIDTVELDIGSFLYMKDIKEMDGVYKIYKVNNYFILRTLNKKVCIFKQTGKQLKRIAVPTILTDSIGGRVLEHFDQESNLVYFLDTENSRELYLFDTTKGAFQHIKLKSGDLTIQTITRDSNGNILVQCIDEKKNNTFYYLSYDELVQSD